VARSVVGLPVALGQGRQAAEVVPADRHKRRRLLRVLRKSYAACAIVAKFWPDIM